MTSHFFTGFEHGIGTLTTNGTGLIDFVNDATTTVVVSTQANSGTYSMRCTPAAAGAYIRWIISGAPTGAAGRVYIRIAANPAAACTILDYTITTGGTTGNARIYVNPTGSKIELRQGANLVAASGGSYSLNTWHRIDYYFDVSANPWVMKARLDGGTEFSGTAAVAANSFVNLRMGATLGAETIDLYYDDFIMSNTLADYPFGAGGTEVIKPDADGTHNAGTNTMEDNAGVDIGTTTAFDKINSIPPSSTTYVRQATIGTTNYAEVTLGNPVSSYGSILGVIGYLAYTSASTTANRGATMMSKDGFTTKTDIWGNETTTADMSDGSTANLFYKRALLANVDASNVNSLTARIGYSGDVTPNPYWIDLWAEVAYSAPTGKGIVADDRRRRRMTNQLIVR